MALSKTLKTNVIKEIVDYIINHDLGDYTYSLNISNCMLPKKNMNCFIANESFTIYDVDVSHSEQSIWFTIKACD